MTFGPRRPQMSREDFEELAGKAPENVQLELIDGKLEVKPWPDNRHRAIVVFAATRRQASRSIY